MNVYIGLLYKITNERYIGLLYKITTERCKALGAKIFESFLLLLDWFSMEVSAERCWRGPRFYKQGGGGTVLDTKLSPPQWFCSTMGSDVSQFNACDTVWSGLQGGVHKLKFMKRKDSWVGVKPKSICLPA